MNGMGPIDPKTKTVHVQPGIVLDRVRDAAEKFNLTFAPDPATHSRCTIGGMIGNNSCGVHALMGGKTVDNIVSLDLLLYDGTRLTVGPTTETELAAHIAAGGRIGEIYAALKNIRDTYADQVRAKFPRIPRRVSGYNLDELLPENNFNLARALVGSEGTCAVILGATLQLVESPPCRTLVGVGFPDIFLAADHVPQILEHKPIGLEGVDGYLLDALRRKQKSVEDLKLLPPGDGFLIVEFGAGTQSDANAKARAFVASMKSLPAQPTSRIYTSDEAKRVWHIRESGLGATAFIPGVGTGWEGWEDAAVDPLQLGSYLRAIYALMQEFNYSSAMYGHFGQGCVHMRLNFDLETPAGILKFRQFIDRAADIALAHGGSLSGEHGDGQARGALLPKMFGEDLMQAFRTFKHIFDPTNRMNPGKLIDAHQPHEDLRLGADYRPWQPKTHFAYAEDNGSLASATLRCVGVGACRKTDAGTMCPSFMATGEELHSTRGRAHLLWELMQGEVLPDQWKNEQVKESLDLCLSCKACKSECPVSVDMATYKAEFLSHFYEGDSRPLSHYAFARIDRFAHLASFAPASRQHPQQHPPHPLAHQKNPPHPPAARPPALRQTLHSRPPPRQRPTPPPRPPPCSPHRPPPSSSSGPTLSTTTSTHQLFAPPIKSSPPPASASPYPRNTSAAAAPSTTSACSTPQKTTSSKPSTPSPRSSSQEHPSSSSNPVAPPSSATNSPTSCPTTPAPQSSATRPSSSANSSSNTRPLINRRNSTKRSSSTATAITAPPWACTMRSPSSASPEQTSNSSTPAAAAWPAPSASKKKNTTSRKN